MPQPRDRKAARFVEFVDYIYKVMTQPEVEHAPLPAGQAAVAPLRTPRQKYQMLPHARPGGIAGLLELLHDQGGRDDIYRLAEPLAMDVDDLLPIIEAATMLGFAALKEGDVEVTREGAAFAEADILTRKVLFREAALKHIAILQCIESVLRTKSDHSIPEEFFRDILDEHFSQDEVERQFETAMNWGRYAEIFDYDAENGRLVLAEPTSELNHHPPPKV